MDLPGKVWAGKLDGLQWSRQPPCSPWALHQADPYMQYGGAHGAAADTARRRYSPWRAPTGASPAQMSPRSAGIPRKSLVLPRISESVYIFVQLLIQIV